MNEAAYKQITKRLDNIDDTLKLVQQALIQVARTEEKVAALLTKTSEHDARFEVIQAKFLEGERRFAEIEKRDSNQELILLIVRRALLFLCMVLISYFVAHPERTIDAFKIAIGG